MRNKTSNLRIPRSDALPLTHIDSTVSKAYYLVHIVTRVLYTVRINNVNSVMFVNRQRKMVTFELSKRNGQGCFSPCHEGGTKKNDPSSMSYHCARRFRLWFRLGIPSLLENVRISCYRRDQLNLLLQHVPCEISPLPVCGKQVSVFLAGGY